MNDEQITLHWFLPTYGDSRTITSGGHGSGFHVGDRHADLDYLTQLALAAEHNGFESVLVPTGLWCEDAWLVSAALAARTRHLKFLVAARPGLVSPTLIAQQATTFQKLSDNRLQINVVVGGEDHEQRAFGDFSTKQQRYAQADEALGLIDQLLRSTRPVDRDGEHVRVEQAALAATPDVVPPIFFGGSSAAGIEVAARRADVYLTWGERPADVAAKLDRVREAAARYGRTPEFGIRLHVIARETEKQAWEDAQRLLDALDPREVARIQQGLARSQSEGQRRMTALHGQGRAFGAHTAARDLEIAPNLWAGVGLVRGGAGTALVGSYAQVAERIGEYREAGLGHFVLSGYPHLEEAYHVGEGVVPHLLAAGRRVSGHSGPRRARAAHTPFAAPVSAAP